jgi:hypothetical protein
LLLLLLSGLLLLRLAERQLLALLFQPPPRCTRFEPDGRNPKMPFYATPFMRALMPRRSDRVSVNWT